jgi:hypothetical protein
VGVVGAVGWQKPAAPFFVIGLILSKHCVLLETDLTQREAIVQPSERIGGGVTVMSVVSGPLKAARFIDAL